VSNGRDAKGRLPRKRDWLPDKEGLFQVRRPVMRIRERDSGCTRARRWLGCLMHGGRLDTGVTKGSLSKELAVAGRVGCAVRVLQLEVGRGGMLSSEGCFAM
jgi:hypothetical protein